MYFYGGRFMLGLLSYVARGDRGKEYYMLLNDLHSDKILFGKTKAPPRWVTEYVKELSKASIPISTRSTTISGFQQP
ncbi:hypothetical protein C0J52_21019 [Blattella germanica]|nr:hypothetical protein C0J52_21019 [Blattella germanica]